MKIQVDFANVFQNTASLKTDVADLTCVNQIWETAKPGRHSFLPKVCQLTVPTILISILFCFAPIFAANNQQNKYPLTGIFMSENDNSEPVYLSIESQNKISFYCVRHFLCKPEDGNVNYREYSGILKNISKQNYTALVKTLNIKLNIQVANNFLETDYKKNKYMFKKIAPLNFLYSFMGSMAPVMNIFHAPNVDAGAEMFMFYSSENTDKFLWVSADNRLREIIRINYWKLVIRKPETDLCSALQLSGVYTDSSKVPQILQFDHLRTPVTDLEFFTIQKNKKSRYFQLNDSNTQTYRSCQSGSCKKIFTAYDNEGNIRFFWQKDAETFLVFERENQQEYSLLFNSTEYKAKIQSDFEKIDLVYQNRRDTYLRDLN